MLWDFGYFGLVYFAWVFRVWVFCPAVVLIFCPMSNVTELADNQSEQSSGNDFGKLSSDSPELLKISTVRQKKLFPLLLGPFPARFLLMCQFRSFYSLMTARSLQFPSLNARLK